jgi:hypothetical protein
MMPLFEHGYLGEEAEQTRQEILQKYAELFALLRETNDVCHHYIRTVKCDYQSTPAFPAITYFMRGLTTFQSLIILLERGCIEDVLALSRTLLQACFRLAAIAADPSVINRIVASAIEEDRKRLSRFKSGLLKMPPGASQVDLDAKIADKTAAIQRLGGSMINDKELAEIGGRLGDYYTAYSVQSDAAHTSPTDLQSFVKRDEKDTLIGFNYGPHDRDLITYATYARSLQADNLVNLDKVLKFGLPPRFIDLQNRFVRYRSDMPGLFNPPDY